MRANYSSRLPSSLLLLLIVLHLCAHLFSRLPTKPSDPLLFLLLFPLLHLQSYLFLSSSLILSPFFSPIFLLLLLQCVNFDVLPSYRIVRCEDLRRGHSRVKLALCPLFSLSLSSLICILIPQTPSSIILHKKHNKHSIRFGTKLLVEIWGVRVNQILPLVFYFQIAGRSYTAHSLGAVVYNIFLRQSAAIKR